MTARTPHTAVLPYRQLRQMALAFLATRGPRPAKPALLPAGRSAFGDALGTVVAHADHDGLIACYYEPSVLHSSVALALGPVLSQPDRSLRIELVPARQMPYPGQTMIVAVNDREVAAYVATELIAPALAAALPEVLAAAAAPPPFPAARLWEPLRGPRSSEPAARR